VRVVTWNLKHGRAVPSAGRDLFDEFAVALAGWDWDVALLQEVPPWWSAPLASRTGAVERHVLTSRNFGLALRRFVAVRWPDLAKSNGGGANTILVRGGRPITEHRTRRLSLLPERRWVHAVRLAEGLWIANLHLQGTPEQARAAALAASDWAERSPLIFGGDFNLRSLDLPGFDYAGGHDVDHVLVRGLGATGRGEVLERGRLSDHDPVAVTVKPAVTPVPGPARRSPPAPTPPNRP
jgi:endonuclease/exonuclease/phosphatase family metal-dependent hydrolase